MAAPQQADAENALIRMLANSVQQIGIQTQEIDVRNALIRQTTPCDGQDRVRFRQWIADISLANRSAPQSATWVAMRSALGPLRTEVERSADLWKHANQDRAADNNQPRESAPWPHLMEYLVNVFLGGEEMERKRSELTKVIQSNYESTATYIVRFRERADEAYPTGDNVRNPVHEQTLRDMFLRGLRDTNIAKYVITRQNINTLQEACTAVTNKSDANERYDRLISGHVLANRVETPMEVDAVASNSQNNLLKEVLEAIKKIDKTNCEVKQNGRQPYRATENATGNQVKYNGGGFTPRHGGVYNTPRNNYTSPVNRYPAPRNNEYSNPIQCWHCNKFGHIARTCRVQVNKQQQQPQQQRQQTSTRPIQNRHNSY
jgi:hypothetical protein